MSYKKISIFPDGNSYAYFDHRSDRLVIANSEGIIKVVNVEDFDSQPISIDSLQNLTSVSFHNDTLAITTTEGKLELIDLLKHESSGVIFRSELPLRDLSFINQGNRILCGGDDNKLVIIDLQNNNQYKTITLPDQLLNIAYDHTGELCSVSLSNGSVQIYSVFNEELNLSHTLDNVIDKKVNLSTDKIDFNNEHNDELYTSKTQWSKDGQFLLVPSISNTVQVYQRSDWSKVRQFPSDSKIIDYKLLADKLAILTLNTYKVVNFDSASTVHEDDFELNEDALPLNIEWENKTSLLIGSTYGDILRLKEVVKDIGGDTNTAASLFMDDLEESDDEFAKSDDQTEVNQLLHREERVNGDTNGKRLFLDDDEEENSILDDDDNHTYVRHSHNGFKKHKPTAPAPIRSYAPISKIIPYSPGSTPFVNKGEAVDRRYLTMNNIGYAWIVINKDPGTTNSITVSFFDRSLNSEYHFTDYQKFDLASLNHKSIVLGESSKGSIFYKSHNDMGNESWEKSIPLIKGEEYLTSLCITNAKSNGNNIIAVGTNLGYLRFFNEYGICLNVIKTVPIVSLATSFSGIMLMVNQVTANVYSYSILDVYQDYKIIQQNFPIPLKEVASHKSQLIKGIFFNEYNDPCIVGGYDDTLLVLQSWRETGNAKWVPILNLHNAITEYQMNDNKLNWSCWPLGVINDSLNCLILKNGGYPGFPLPLPVEIDIEIPIKLGPGAEPQQKEEDDCEEQFIRSLTMGKLLSDTLANYEEEQPGEDIDQDTIITKLNQYSTVFDKSLLKLFGEACKQSKLNKAYSIAKLIKTDKALLAASKISERMEFLTLASKIGQLREQLLVDLDDD
ncbi:mcl1 [Candida margitis]|uniref:mcl1 n=1 Tax=Candida margitis TaxID=1775924 RepID=UPI0022273153|nr:mcl1 [Candida margitis]KAI5961511.1 mcl1 [Candida margitis]